MTYCDDDRKIERFSGFECESTSLSLPSSSFVKFPIFARSFSQMFFHCTALVRRNPVGWCEFLGANYR